MAKGKSNGATRKSVSTVQLQMRIGEAKRALAGVGEKLAVLERERDAEVSDYEFFASVSARQARMCTALRQGYLDESRRHAELAEKHRRLAGVNRAAAGGVACGATLLSSAQMDLVAVIAGWKRRIADVQDGAVRRMQARLRKDTERLAKRFAYKHYAKRTENAL